MLVAALGCTGTLLEPDGTGPNGPNGPNGPGGPGAPGGPNGPGNNPGAAGADTKGVDPGSKVMHRLNRAEYNATVQDVLGTTLAPATELWRGGENHGFDNIADVLGIDELQYQRYFEAAEAVARDVFASAATRARIVTCATADDAKCVDAIVTATGLRVLRRPLSAEEVTTYRRVYERARQLGADHNASLEQVLRAFLSSVEFLYRIETDPDPSSTTPHAVGPYELASRLSYFLWSSAPDDRLLGEAKDGTVGDVNASSAIIDRMLADPRSERLIQNFVGQWLGARRVSAHAVSPELFPEWSPALANAMAEEIYRFFSEFLRNDRSYLDFLKADVNFVNADLARLYGMSPPGQGTARVEVKNDERVGFFGLGGFLALSSYEYRTAPTLRGRWILINLLCSPPHDPPPGVPILDQSGEADAAEQNVRQRLEEHRTNPDCRGCHSAMDPYGIALENFDAIGKYRSTYRNGSPVDATTELPDGTRFEGMSELADVVTKKPNFTKCVAEKLFVYALGRGLETTDAPYLAGLEQSWQKQTPTLRSLITAMVQADPFRQRRAAVSQ